MNCELLRKNRDAWLDGELEPSLRFEFEEHLGGCAPCNELVSFENAFRNSVRTALQPVEAPPKLRVRVRAALDGVDSARSARPGILHSIGEHSWWRYSIPTAAALFFVGLQTLHSDQPSINHASAMPIFEDVGRLHWSSLPADVQGNPEALRGYFQSRIDFPVRPVEFSRPGARLVAARLSNVRDRHAAALYYDVNGRRVTVVVFEPPLAADIPGTQIGVGGRKLYYQTVRGYAVALRNQDGLAYAFTGDMSPHALLELAASARVRY